MKALITGASSGLGREFAIQLSNRGYDLILVARREERLKELKEILTTDVQIISTDLSSVFNCAKLFDKIKNQDIDVVINNAGFGLASKFVDSSLERELDMIDLNIKTVHVLTKNFVQKFIDQDKGYILNVASAAAFQPGPLMATYYATKNYVYALTMAVAEELHKDKSNVYIGCLCPGPVNTEFNKVAKVEFALKGLSSEYVVRYALKKMFKKKKTIIPGFKIKVGYILSKFAPMCLKLPTVYKIQRAKIK